MGAGVPRPAPRSQVRLWDGRWWPSAGRYAGAPVFRYGWAPSGLVTRRQLRAAGLRPAGQDPAGWLVWGPGSRPRWAYLYRLDLAAPVRVMSAAQRAGIAWCNAAQQVCPTCARDVGYRIPRSLRECWTCATAADDAERQEAGETGPDFTAEWAAHRPTDQHEHEQHEDERDDNGRDAA